MPPKTKAVKSKAAGVDTSAAKTSAAKKSPAAKARPSTKAKPATVNARKSTPHTASARPARKGISTAKAPVAKSAAATKGGSQTAARSRPSGTEAPKTSVKSVAANAKSKTAARGKKATVARSAAPKIVKAKIVKATTVTNKPVAAEPVATKTAAAVVSETKVKKAVPVATAPLRKAQMPKQKTTVQKTAAPMASDEAIPATKTGSQAGSVPKTSAAKTSVIKTPATKTSATKTSAAAKSATTRHAAAAFVAARKKMAPATPLASSGDDSALKSGAEILNSKSGDGTLNTDIVETVPAQANVQPQAPIGAATRPAVAARPPVPAAVKPKPATTKAPAFKTGEYIVYPAHGVGEIVAIEQQEVAGYKLELFVISFVKDKMILKVPLPKAASVGMRKLAEGPVLKRALDTLTGRARVKRTMWSRRAQEYEAKINSGDIVAIAEVVRDLYRSDAQPEQSYSERQLYEAALDRMARELAAVQKLTDTEALKVIDDQLQKGPRRSKAEENEAEDGDDTDEAEGGIGEAA